MCGKCFYGMLNQVIQVKINQMKKLATFLLAILSIGCMDQSTQKFNFGFENTTPGQKIPDNWSEDGRNCDYLRDTIIKHSGKNAMLLQLNKAIGYGELTYIIPAYEGKEIELRVYVKGKDIKESENAIALEIYGALGELIHQQTTPEEGFQGTFDWTMYSIKFPLAENAKTFMIKAWLSDAGQLWVDDFEILIDGRDISQAKQKEIKALNAEIDNEFDHGSKVKVLIPNDEKVSDLKILGMVWGFLKYYHPNIAAGDYNWDYELFRILPKIMNAKSDQDRDAILTNWIKNLGICKVAKKTYELNQEVKMRPDLDWITNSNFTINLTSQLLKVKNAERKKTHYYMNLWDDWYPQFKNEKAYPDMKYPDDGFRLLSLYRYWNIIQYYFPYRNLIEEDWKEVLMEFVPKFIHAANELEYKLVVMELIVRIHDSHADIRGKYRDSTLRNYYGVNRAPIETNFIENKLVVTNFYTKGLNEISGLQAGDIISTINNKSVENIVSENLKYSSGSNYPTQLRTMAFSLLRTSDTILNIEFIRNGISEFKKIKGLVANFNYGISNAKYLVGIKDTCFKLITPNIAYINAWTLKSEHVSSIINEIKDTKGMIIDLRRSSSTGLGALSEYLLPDSIAFAKWTVGNILHPGTFIFHKTAKSGTKNNDYYKGKVIILVNEYTQSSLEYATMVLETAPNAIVIGSTTAGADGNVTYFHLPGGIKTLISGVGVYYPDGTETQRVGIVPDIFVKPTIEGIRLGKDEVLEKAVEVINK